MSQRAADGVHPKKAWNYRPKWEPFGLFQQSQKRAALALCPQWPAMRLPYNAKWICRKSHNHKRLQRNVRTPAIHLQPLQLAAPHWGRWQDIPVDLPSGSSTCWRRLQEWAGEGVLPDIQGALIGDLAELWAVDLEQLFADATFIRTKKGVTKSAKPRLARG